MSRCDPNLRVNMGGLSGSAWGLEQRSGLILGAEILRVDVEGTWGAGWRIGLPDRELGSRPVRGTSGEGNGVGGSPEGGGVQNPESRDLTLLRVLEVRNIRFHGSARNVSSMAATFSTGMSDCIRCDGPRISPVPSGARSRMQASVAARTSAGETLGRTSWVEMPP